MELGESIRIEWIECEWDEESRDSVNFQRAALNDLERGDPLGP